VYIKADDVGKFTSITQANAYKVAKAFKRDVDEIAYDLMNKDNDRVDLRANIAGELLLEDNSQINFHTVTKKVISMKNHINGTDYSIEEVNGDSSGKGLKYAEHSWYGTNKVIFYENGDMDIKKLLRNSPTKEAANRVLNALGIPISAIISLFSSKEVIKPGDINNFKSPEQEEAYEFAKRATGYIDKTMINMINSDDTKEDINNEMKGSVIKEIDGKKYHLIYNPETKEPVKLTCEDSMDPIFYDNGKKKTYNDYYRTIEIDRKSSDIKVIGSPGPGCDYA